MNDAHAPSESNDRALHALAEADMRRRHPNAGRREVELRIASRRLDADTMRRAFG